MSLKSFIETELLELQAIEPIYIDVQKLTTITNGLWVATGRSKRHTQAMAENLMEKLKAAGMPALSLSGYENGEWILIDCDDCLVHLMLPETRALYQLEELWDVSKHMNAAKSV